MAVTVFLETNGVATFHHEEPERLKGPESNQLVFWGLRAFRGLRQDSCAGSTLVGQTCSVSICALVEEERNRWP